MPTVEERVDSLESILGQFIVHTDVALRRLETEMRAFKDEMKEFKDEMKEFKDEMADFKNETKADNKRRNREWSDLAKKMGTMVEDLIAPALRPVLKKYFSCEVTMEGQRMFRRKDGEDYEVDAIVASKDKVFMVEVRSTPRVDYVNDIEEKSKRFFDFFPEYANKELIIIFGGISFPENIIKYASKKKIYIMAWREWEYMDILNYEEINVSTNKYSTA